MDDKATSSSTCACQSSSLACMAPGGLWHPCCHTLRRVQQSSSARRTGCVSALLQRFPHYQEADVQQKEGHGQRYCKARGQEEHLWRGEELAKRMALFHKRLRDSAFAG